MAILREIDRTRHVQGDRRIEQRGGGGVQHLGLKPDFMGLAGDLRLLVEPLRRLAKHQQPAFHQPKIFFHRQLGE